MNPSDKGLILCVDDDPAVVKTIASVLELEGYKVVCAMNGLDGLKTFERYRSQLRGIFTDAKMPKMSGLEFARKIREAGSTIPIVLITAYLNKSAENKASYVTVKEYHDVGINAHIEKPFRVEDILQMIKMTFEINAT